MPRAFFRFVFLVLTGLLANLSLALLPGPFSAPVHAQVPGGAQLEAQTRLVCGTGTVLSATYLPGGLLQVTCQSTSAQNAASASQLPTALEGTALTTTATTAVITVLVVAAILAGDEGTETSTSSSSTSGFGGE